MSALGALDPRTSPRTADLVGRYLATLQSSAGRPNGNAGLIEAFKLDALDWRLEHGLATADAQPLLPPIDVGRAR